MRFLIARHTLELHTLVCFFSSLIFLCGCTYTASSLHRHADDSGISAAAESLRAAIAAAAAATATPAFYPTRMENAAAAAATIAREARKRRCAELLAPEGGFECRPSSSDAPDADVDADAEADADGLSFGLESVSVGTTSSDCSDADADADADGDADMKAERELLNAAAGGAGISHAVFASVGAHVSDWKATATGALAALDDTCVKARPAMLLGDDLKPQQICGVCEDTAAGTPIIVPAS